MSCLSPLVPAFRDWSARSINITRLDLPSCSTLLLPAPRAARKQLQQRPKEEQHKRRQQGPNPNLKPSMAMPIIIDLLLHNSPSDEISDQDHKSNQPRHTRDERRAQGTEDGCTQRGEEGEEGKTAGDGVEHHDAGECVGGVL